jgi:lycopene cyclase domain-containing protein
MLGRFTYLFIILAPGLVFNLVTWGIWWRVLVPRINVIATTILISTAYWGILDLIAVRGLGIWSFRPEHISGLTILSLPLEEWVLFLASGGFIVPLIFVFLDRSRAATKATQAP